MLLLPLYFALSGLSTNLGLLNDGITWGYVIAIIVVAFSGKIIGGTLAAKACRLVWRESLSIGVLMSCKGLVELIVLVSGSCVKQIASTILTQAEYRFTSQDFVDKDFHYICCDGTCHNRCHNAVNNRAIPSLVPEETRGLEERRN